MAHAVHHHLGHGRLAAGGLATGFVVHGVGQALELARALQGIAQLERAGLEQGRAADVESTAEAGAQHQRTGAAALVGQQGLRAAFEASGKLLGLTIAAVDGGEEIGIMTLGHGKGAGVHTRRSAEHRRVGEVPRSAFRQSGDAGMG